MKKSITNDDVTDEEVIRVLKSGTCPSLTGKSKLMYEFGAGPGNQLNVRIARNSGTGWISPQWVSWPDLLEALQDAKGEPITSFTLRPLYAGRSVNTAGFLLAALMNEGLVQRMEDRPRCYELLDARRFLAEMDSLVPGPKGGGGGGNSSARATRKAVKAVKAVTADTAAPAPIKPAHVRAGKR